MRPIATYVTGILGIAVIVLGSGNHTEPRAAEPDLARYKASFQPLPDAPAAPPDNPTRRDKVELGKMLYFDRRLSKTGATSCNYCHDLAYYGAEPVAKSLGIEGKVHLRHSPTVLNSGFLRGQFWDGRDPDLETQALSAIKSPVAMGEDPARAAKRLNAIPEYRARFRSVFGTDATPEAIGKAVAAFERTLNTPDYPLARYLKGDDGALRAEQKEGMGQ